VAENSVRGTTEARRQECQSFCLKNSELFSLGSVHELEEVIMTFEEMLRDRIAKSPYASRERNTLKLVLGDLQQKAASGNVTDEVAHAIVKKIIKGNEETLGYLSQDDVRRGEHLDENEILSGLLPKYLTADQIRESLVAAGIDVKSIPNEGQATGKAMQHFKTNNSPVEGQTVKEVVRSMRIA